MAAPHFWLAVGTPENWLFSLTHGSIWGLRAGGRLEPFWDLLEEDDLLLFHVKAPVGGVVGFGTIKTKHKDAANPLWPDEISEGKILYPLRFHFDVDKVLAPNSWKKDRIPAEALKRLLQAGFQPIGAEVALPLIRALSPEWVLPPRAVPATGAATGKEPSSLSHDQIQSMLVEIGRIQKFLADPEYSMDTGRLDVVWRRIEKSVPTYVFEVQVAGDLYHALGKLKHAYDLWNSYIFLVAHPTDWAKCDQLLTGTFHEIRHHLRFLPISKIAELHETKRAFKELEKSLGIPS